MDDVSKLVHILRKTGQEFSVNYSFTNNGKWVATTTVNNEYFCSREFITKKESKHELATIVIAKFKFDEPTNSERKDKFRTGKFRYTVDVDNYECEVTTHLGETFHCRFSNLQTEIIKHTIKD